MFFSKKTRKMRMLLLAVLSFGCFSSVYGSEQFMPISEVREGMKGYAKTVVHGTKIETFDVDVLGIMKNKGATGGDLVLVKVSGPLIDETHGIAQGMSGSPVYIDGKLLGAVAYGFPQSGGRIGMVTPISDMLNLWTIDDSKVQESIKGNKNLIPLETPVMATGYTTDGMEYLTDKMKDFHLIPYATASVSEDATASLLEPGGAVAATLVTGDLKLGAIGTVTYVDGNKMVAFGHPFLDKGNSSYFMHNSYIFTVVPSDNIPFKIGTVGATIGKINQDRGAGIGGISGEYPSSVGLNASVEDLDMAHNNNLSVRMINNERLLPMLTATSLYNVMSNTMDRKGQGTVSFTYTLFPKDLKKKPFTRSNMYWSSTDIAERSVDEIYNVVKALEQNRFEPYELRDIKVDMQVTSEKQTAQLLDATAYPTIVSPGDTIYIRVRIQPYRGEITYKDMTFTVPKDRPFGSMMLEVRGGGEIPLPYLIQQQKLNLSDEIIRRLRVYKDFNDLFNKLAAEDKNNEIVAEIINPDISMITKGEEEKSKAEIKEKAPSEIPDYLKNKNRKEKSADDDSPKSKIETNYIVLGDGQFSFQVMSPEKRDAALKKMAASKKQVKADLQNKKDKTIAENSKIDSK